MAEKSPMDIARERIAQAERTRSTELNLSRLGVEALPPELGRLTNLERLYLTGNRLTALPSELGGLTNLRDLSLRGNRLMVLPPELGRLTNLTQLWLRGNRLTVLPPELGRLTNLTDLSVQGNRLTVLPPELGRLTNLTRLWLAGNALTALPPELGELEKLQFLSLNGNPLPEPLMAAHRRGIGKLLAYLRSLKEAEPLYEAKLLLVGEGKVGKSCLLDALEGRPFKEGRDTTHGMEIRTLLLPHPHGDKTLTLNCWDFGGQPVYRISHQFFYSRRSLYLLVWDPRSGAEKCDVEGWIKRIRLRVGDGARILIVATHCETGDRIARIDEAILKRDYGDLIVGFHEVDSQTGKGIVSLKHRITEAASSLPQMGEPFSKRWKTTRDEVLALRDANPRIPFATFREICSKHELDDMAIRTLADLMHDLGHWVYFGDDEGLKDEAVLQPEWLTKAIGFVLEDRPTNEAHGVLPHDRLRGIWFEHARKDEPRYDPRLHPFFLRLMEKYDVSYRLPDEQSSLVTQLVPDVRPDLPWTDEKPAPPDRPQISLVCQMDEVPPGLVPWLIVRTHYFAAEDELHWQKGMFLEQVKHGEALLELRGRELATIVRAEYPDYFMSILRHTLERLIEDRWPGLKWTLSVPCPHKGKDGKPCNGRFPLDTLHKLKAKMEVVPCMACSGLSRIDKLLTGFEPPPLTAAVAGLQSQIAASVALLLRVLSTETRECPRLFTLLPEDLSAWNPKNLGMQGYRLTLWWRLPGRAD